ncbi:MAG: cell division protein ZapE [Alphaproteobacteria bacterium]
MTPSSPPQGHLQEKYLELCQKKGLTVDPRQQEILKSLDTFRLELQSGNKKPSLLKKLLGKKQHPDSSAGVYIYGDVGRGKTFLMDLFCESIDFMDKWRVHFHTFMQYLHQERKRLRDSGVEHPLPVLIDQIAKKSPLLCFDEFHVTDIADAMILSRLFRSLLEKGVRVVATSNFMPSGLYPGGLHRDRFEPFIELVEEKFEIVNLDGQVDYRQQLLSDCPRYYYPLSPKSTNKIQSLFDALLMQTKPCAYELEVNGRLLHFDRTGNGTAWLTFDEVCAQPLAASDYIALSQAFNTIILTHVPVMDEDLHNEAKRFITMIDVLYDSGTNLIIGAEAAPGGLYSGERHAEIFERTISRLQEMTGVKR